MAKRESSAEAGQSGGRGMEKGRQGAAFDDWLCQLQIMRAAV